MGRKDEVRTNRAGGYIETTQPGGYDVMINGTNRYLNFYAVSGALGYGFRDNSGIIQWKNLGGSWVNISAGGGSGGHVIQWDGVAVTPRTNLNFTGPAVTLTDDAVNDAIVVDIAGGAGKNYAWFIA